MPGPGVVNTCPFRLANLFWHAPITISLAPLPPPLPSPPTLHSSPRLLVQQPLVRQWHCDPGGPCGPVPVHVSALCTSVAQSSPIPSLPTSDPPHPVCLPLAPIPCLAVYIAGCFIVFPCGCACVRLRMSSSLSCSVCDPSAVLYTIYVPGCAGASRHI